jgi:hypothetical protein
MPVKKEDSGGWAKQQKPQKSKSALLPKSEKSFFSYTFSSFSQNSFSANNYGSPPNLAGEGGPRIQVTRFF